jgi:cobalt-zinc-cadmium efflux system protein
MTNNSRFKYGLILNSGFAIAEFSIGLFTGSLALISDAIHNFSDSLSLIIAWIADVISHKKADNSNTYGLKRAKILGALLNACILFLIAGYIFSEAYQKFVNPQPVQGGIITIVSFVGIIINTSVALLFKDSTNDLNKKAAFVNMALDAVASLMAMIGGIIIYFTGSAIIDPIISVIIGILLSYNSWEIIREIIEILLESTPTGIIQNEVETQILTHDCVNQVVDLHIWSLTSEYSVLTAVLNIKPNCVEHLDNFVEAIKADLETKFHIDHQTIETRINAVPHVD